MNGQVFVTREGALAQLAGTLDRALAGRGQACFVVGNAGSGKTALVTEFARRAQETQADLLVAIGTCNAQTGSGDPYLPFRELLGVLTGDVEDKLAQGTLSPENTTRLQAVLARSVQILIEVAPELVGLLVPGTRIVGKVGRAVAEQAGWMDKLDELAEGKAQPDLEQSHVFEQVTKLLTSLAAEQPLILVLDDLQWADQASASLLFHLGRRLDQHRILLVGIYRPADIALGRGGGRHPLERVLNEFRRYYGDIWLDLDRTTKAEGQRFVDSLLDLQPNRLGEAFRRALFEHTEGHPLFTVELLQHMREAGSLVQDERGRWMEGPALDWRDLPARVEGVIKERVDRLAADQRDLLTVASVEGEEFTLEVIARVQGLGARGLARQLGRELEERHRLVRAAGFRQLDRQRLFLYRFWHSLFQRYLYNGLDEVQRAYLHGDVGLALEALYGDQAPEIALQLARHFEAAGLPEKALAYLQVAGERAGALYAPHEAVEHLTRALAMASRASIVPPPVLYRDRGQAYETLGEFQAAHDDFAAALAGAREAGDRRLEWRALLDLGEVWASRDYDRTGAYYRQALERARALGDPAALARTLNRIGNWHMNVEQPREALQYHQEALDLFRELDDRHGVAETLDLFGMATALGGDLVRSQAYYAQAVALFRELDDRPGLISSLASTMGGWDYLTETLALGEMARADCLGEAETALRIAREIDHRSGEAYTLFSLGFCLGPQGAYGRALDDARASLEIAEEIEHHQWMAAAHCALGTLYLDILALPQARAHLEQALDLAREIGSRFWIRTVAGFLAAAYVQQGELALAEAVLDAALAPDTPCETMGQRLAWCGRGQWALAAGDAARALRIAERLLATAINLPPGGTIPRLAWLRGEALAALGRDEEAEEVLQAALAAAERQGSRPLQWRIHTALGHLYRAGGRPAAAAAAYGAAGAIVAELAAHIPDEALRKGFVRQAGADRAG